MSPTRGKRPTKAWGVVAAVTGAMLVVAAAPGQGQDADTVRSTAGSGPKEAAVTLLVGRAVDEGARAAAGRCAVHTFRPGLCGGWREQRVQATSRGTGSVLRMRALGDASRAARADALPTDADAPLEIALADRGRLTDVTVTDGHGRHLAA